jgi:hypothetical protein
LRTISSAVVPPSSTPEVAAHLRVLQDLSKDESDGTSFTEDEVEDVPGIDEAEGEEDRLILSGGAEKEGKTWDKHHSRLTQAPNRR